MDIDIKIYNLFKNANNGPVLSKFLTIDEQAKLVNNNFKIDFSKTYPEEERKRAYIYSKDIDIKTNFNISIFKIKSRIELRHPEILGSVLSLGLTREVIGDIIIDNGDYFLIVASEIKKFIEENLTMISKARVELVEVDSISELTTSKYITESIIIASLRLDAVIAKTIHASRGQAQEFINNKLVKINGAVNQNNAYLLKEGDIVSITKFGRLVVKDISRITKKDKIVLNIERTK